MKMDSIDRLKCPKCGTYLRARHGNEPDALCHACRFNNMRSLFAIIKYRIKNIFRRSEDKGESK